MSQTDNSEGVTDLLADQDREPATVSPSRGVRAKRKTSAHDFALQRAAEALARRQNAQEEIVLQEVLPFWTDEHRGVPNPILRSGLFGAKLPSARHFTKAQKVASLGNYDLNYTGEELLQEDLSVWISLLNFASKQRFGDAVFVTGYKLIKDLGWRMHGDSYTNAKESISRLKANEIVIQLSDGSAGYAGSLIREYAWSAHSPDGKLTWMVRFEPRIIELFQKELVSTIWWEQRKLIPVKNSLARWLHAFYSTHTKPIPFTVAKLHELCKSEEKNLRAFKARLIKCMALLIKIGAIESYRIEEREVEGEVKDFVHVAMPPAPVRLLSQTLTRRLATA
jgi:TrfA protein